MGERKGWRRGSAVWGFGGRVFSIVDIVQREGELLSFG